MNKKTIVIGIIGIIAIVGAVSLISNSNNSGIAAVNTTPATTPPVTTQAQTVASSSPAAASSTTPLMQSTGALFTQYKNYSKAHEVFPTLAPDTKKALGAFSYTKEDLGNNTFRFTLTNNAEGYKGQSVVVSGSQSVYFIEPANGDDSASEDSITTDDSLVAVDAQGYVLK